MEWANEQLAKTYDQFRAWYEDPGKKRGKWWMKSFRQVLASDHMREVEFHIEKEIHAVVNAPGEATQREAGKRVLEGCAYLRGHVAKKMKIEG
jgi:poly(3-hydroxyalkanoate) synthetase